MTQYNRFQNKRPAHPAPTKPPATHRTIGCLQARKTLIQSTLHLQIRGLQITSNGLSLGYHGTLWASMGTRGFPLHFGVKKVYKHKLNEVLRIAREP
ncbi:hypothetical protein [Rhizobium sp. L1K21]|uniref:hypothetical protein n=1 Tax=Rhizobium sp. L1K21 TaxID=2954933 RepID=UPI0020923A03|nr:hypothetical protein [Rhizobium sp. L1K21]MCO6185635.1 hypothetical protein [Rhizobium sp. L1K21]